MTSRRPSVRRAATIRSWTSPADALVIGSGSAAWAITSLYDPRPERAQRYNPRSGVTHGEAFSVVEDPGGASGQARRVVAGRRAPRDPSADAPVLEIAPRLRSRRGVRGGWRAAHAGPARRPAVRGR